ncbi:hypothetical protein [uncultured Comamonas sp.]|uniref:hypothetical protein n=1 Tax=uncultured Comamonas sp. TaxID=114710 RepID=UPI003749E3F4
MNKDQLAKLTQFTNLVEFEKAFADVRKVSNLVKLKAAVVDDSGYVFKPVTPCGLVDSRFRNAAKPLIANVAEQFNIWDGVIQGSTAPCSAASIPAGDIGALALTATVVGAASDGWLIMSPAGDASESSVLNYMPRDAIANSTVLKYTSGFTLKASTNAHALVSLIGVYVKSEEPKLSCYDTPFVDVMIPPGERMDLTLLACSTGYQAVSASCVSAGLSLMGNEAAFVDPRFGGTGFCSARNNIDYTAQLAGRQKCCKVTR